MTDKLISSVLVEKAFVYITSLTRECRKALVIKFESKYKGIPFDSVDAVLRREVESWFTKRDKNVKLSYIKSVVRASGEILVTYSGVTKNDQFNIQVNGIFTLADSSANASSYLKNLNFNVDKRDFMK